MNHDCNGDFFTFKKKKYYKCLLDSSIIKADKLVMGSDCPNCNRKIDGTFNKIKCYKIVKKVIFELESSNNINIEFKYEIDEKNNIKN